MSESFVAGAVAVEAGEHVVGSLLQSPTERDEPNEGSRDTSAEGVDQLLTKLAVRFAIGGAHPLGDSPGHLDFDVRVTIALSVEQVSEAVLLLVGEKVGTGLKGPLCAMLLLYVSFL
ncbi:hypothetical protein AB0M72_21295 [Nocardiopsis dassonvillei]